MRIWTAWIDSRRANRPSEQSLKARSSFNTEIKWTLFCSTRRNLRIRLRWSRMRGKRWLTCTIRVYLRASRHSIRRLNNLSSNLSSKKFFSEDEQSSDFNYDRKRWESKICHKCCNLDRKNINNLSQARKIWAANSPESNKIMLSLSSLALQKYFLLNSFN